MKMFCAGACDPVQGLICLLASRFKIKPNVKVVFYDNKVLGLYGVNW